MKRFFQQQSGATIIEFAVVAPVVFLLLMGLIEFGRI
ncbi:MAG: TadE/TadG family type IV pilus assembly protein, partial [Alphaproteobacteria bacterium]